MHFQVGDRVVNIDNTSENCGKKATVLGFHAFRQTSVFVKYDDGFFGSGDTYNGGLYQKICSCGCHCCKN